MLASLKTLAVALSSSPTGNVDVVVNRDDDDIIEARTISYPKQVLYLIASFIALVSLSHFLSLGYRYTTRQNRASKIQSRSGISAFRLPAALVDSLRALVFRWTVPIGSSFTLNFAEVGLTLGYIGILLSWTFVNTTTTSGIRVEPNYYADRAGRIAASQLPILVALGMRNNFISWITGVSFEKLNYLHRMSARVICIMIWIHGGAWFAIGLTDDNDLANRWLQCGLVAASALTLLIILTIRPVRQRNYESFLLVHLVFALIFIITLFFHLSDVNNYMAYYGAWPAMLVWGLERFLRLVRLVVYNFTYLNPFGSKSTEGLNANVDVLSEHALRVTTRRPSHFHWRPGQSVFLSFPSVNWYPFQAHPFTIATIDGSDGTSSEENKLIFLFRVRNGFTKELMRVASPGQNYRVFINGPYSSPPFLVGYETVILIAGGSGITFTLPLFLGLIRQAKRDERLCQKVIFMWAIRSAEHVRWIEDILAPALGGIPQSMTVVIEFYVTKAEEKWADDESNTSSAEKLDKNHSSCAQPVSMVLDSPLVSFKNGRPDLQNIIQNEIADASGRMSINACGTNELADTVRKSIRAPRLMDILRGGPTVTLHIETFGS